jgi:hypothetical protein
MTFREYAAAVALQGILANNYNGTGYNEENAANTAASLADKLIKALNKPAK